MRRASRILLLTGCLVLVSEVFADRSVAAAGQQSPIRPTSAEAALPSVTLRFFNREIATFRAPYLGYTPVERASVASQRVHQALERRGPGAVSIKKTDDALLFSIDGLYIFRMLEADLDDDDGQTFEQAQVVVRRRLEDAIGAYRESGTARVVVRGLGFGAAATALLLLAAWLLFRARLWIRRRIDVMLARRLHLGVHERASLLRLSRAVGQILYVVLMAALLEEWLRFVLALFPYTRPWADHLTGFVGGIIPQVGSAIVDAVPGLAMVAVIAALAHLAVKIVRTVSRAVEANRYRPFGIDAEIAQPTRRIVTAVIWLFALAMAYPYLPGASSDAFKGLSVLLGLMLSLGATGVVGQVAASFILTFSRAVRGGDWVRIAEVEGAVVSVGVFSTRIRTYNDEEVSIPNTVVLGTITKNFSRPIAQQGAILETAVSIGYDTPWRQVHAMLQEAATRTPELERDPPPDVLQTGLSDFYVQYVLRARLRNPHHRPAVLSALNANVQDVFNEYGVQIMSPHYLTDPTAPKVVPKARWFDPPADSSPVDR